MLRFNLMLFLTSLTISVTAQNPGCLYNIKGFSPRGSRVGEETECDKDSTDNTSKDIASELQSKSDTPVCGYRNLQGINSPIQRISGDVEAEYGEFPWMVAILLHELLFDEVTLNYQCGGSLIHPSVVVTAAHCILRESKYTIRAGEWDTQTNLELYPTQDREVTDYIIHDRYYKGALLNDIALLFFTEPFQIVSNVKPICLPPQNYNFDLEHCVVSGWGNEKFMEEKIQAILKRVELDIIPRDVCVAKLRETDLKKDFDLHDSFICAGGKRGEDTCKGDGGSPLVCPIPDTENRYYQAGIVSWGIGCGDSIPAVYVNLALFRNWIEEKLESRGIPKSYFVAT